MKKLVWDEDVTEVDLGDGDFVSVASSISVKGAASLGIATTQAEISVSLLRHVIRSWRGPSFEHNGEPVPCTEENIDRLEVSVATIISNHVVEMMSANRLDDEAKNVSTASSSST